MSDGHPASTPGGSDPERTDPGDTPRPHLLACGRDADDLIDQVADGDGHELDAHQRGCAHCRATLAEFERLWSPVRAVTDYRPFPREDLVEAALRSMRGVSADPRHARIDEPGGSTRIAARVVVVLARYLAGTVPGVRAALSELLGSAPEVVVGVAGMTTVVEITLAADMHSDLRGLAERIRRVVGDGLRAGTGLDHVEVRVSIDDVLPRLRPLR